MSEGKNGFIQRVKSFLNINETPIGVSSEVPTLKISETDRLKNEADVYLSNIGVNPQQIRSKNKPSIDGGYEMIFNEQPGISHDQVRINFPETPGIYTRRLELGQILNVAFHKNLPSPSKEGYDSGDIDKSYDLSISIFEDGKYGIRCKPLYASMTDGGVDIESLKQQRRYIFKNDSKGRPNPEEPEIEDLKGTFEEKLRTVGLLNPEETINDLKPEKINKFIANQVNTALGSN